MFINTCTAGSVSAWSYSRSIVNFLLFLRSNCSGVSEEIVTSSLIVLKFSAKIGPFHTIFFPITTTHEDSFDPCCRIVFFDAY